MPLGIGIDLGTTRSAAAVYMNEEVTMIPQDSADYFLPSVVSFTPNGVLIGCLAEEQSIVDPKNTIVGVKRVIGRRFDDPALQKFMSNIPYKIENVGGNPKISVMYKGEPRQYEPECISALILKKLKDKTEIILGHKAESVVITVPAFFSDSQRQATKDAGCLAGFDVLQILNEPTAAAIAYGLNTHSKEEKYVLIYSFGSGMFDACILKIKHGNVFETQATVGDTSLGGVDIDYALLNYCVDFFYKKHNKNIKNNNRAERRLRIACKNAKFNLSTTHETTIDIHSLMDGIDFNLKISRLKFEELCESIFNQTIELLHQVVVDSGLNKKDIDDVVLSGGCTKIPKIRELVSDYFDGKYVSDSLNPSLAVAYGAAVRAAFLTGFKDRKIKDMLCVDVTPLSIGIETLGGIMTIVIERSSPIPMKASYTITTQTDNQKSVRIRVFEGERALTSNNHLLGTLELVGLPPMPRGVPRVEVTFEIDCDGILKVSAEEKSAMKFDTTVIKLEKGRLDREDIDRILKEADEFEEEDEVERERFRYRKSLEVYVNKICKAAFTDPMNRMSDRDKLEIKKICNETREWLEQNPTAKVNAIAEKRSAAIKVLQPYASRLDQSVVSREDVAFVSGGSLEEVMYFHRIVTKLGEEMIVPAFLPLDYSCSCALTKESCLSNQIFNPATCRCEYQSSEKSENKNTEKEPDVIGCNCICPLFISQMYSTGAYFPPGSHQFAPFNSLQGRKPPV